MRAKQLLERWNKINEEEAQKLGPRSQKKIEGTIKAQIAVLQSQVNNPNLSAEKKDHAKKSIAAFNKRLIDVKKGIQYPHAHYFKESLDETAAVVASLASKSGKSVADVEKMWDAIKKSLKEQGHKESDDNFYAMLVGGIKKNLGLK
jgi:hypothetical protein